MKPSSKRTIASNINEIREHLKQEVRGHGGNSEDEDYNSFIDSIEMMNLPSEPEQSEAVSIPFMSEVEEDDAVVDVNNDDSWQFDCSVKFLKSLSPEVKETYVMMFAESINLKGFLITPRSYYNDFTFLDGGPERVYHLAKAFFEKEWRVTPPPSIMYWFYPNVIKMMMHLDKFGAVKGFKRVTDEAINEELWLTCKGDDN